METQPEINHSKIEEMKMDVSSIEKESPFMTPGKKRRGRKPKSATPPGGSAVSETGQPPQVNNTETFKQILGPVWKTISHVAAEICDEPKAEMTVMEHELITNSSAACANQYIPDAIGAHANLFLFLTAAGTYSARIYMLYSLKKKLMQENKIKDLKPSEGFNHNPQDPTAQFQGFGGGGGN